MGNIAFRWKKLNLLLALANYGAVILWGLMKNQCKWNQVSFSRHLFSSQSVPLPIFEVSKSVIKVVYLWSWLCTVHSTYWNYWLTPLLLKILSSFRDMETLVKENDPDHWSSYLYKLSICSINHTIPESQIIN